MSKKRNKSPANNAAINNKWEPNIVSAELNEGEWNYSLSYLVEDIVEDKETIEYIKQGISTGLRRKFTLLNSERILELVGEYGGSKSKKGKDAPPNYEVCESAKTYLDRGEAIPANMIARLIKWVMLTNKLEDVKIKLEGGKKVEGKGSKSKKTNEKPDASKSSAGKKGAQAAGKKSPEPLSVKGDTKLRKRGDPDPDIQYIDDEPDDGSSRYFVITGAPDPSVIVALAEIGCIVTSVVKVTRDIHIPKPESDDDDENAVEAPLNSQIAEETEEEKSKATVALSTFWDNLTGLLNDNQHLRNTPIVTLVAKHLMFPVNREDTEQTRACAMQLFESVAVLMYDLLDLRRQWRNYLDKGKIYELPTRVKEDSKPDTVAAESSREEKPPIDDGQAKSGSSDGSSFASVDMEYYQFLLQNVAIEDTSVYLQMGAMLDQVDVTCGDQTADWDKPKLSQPSDLSEEAAQILDGMVDKLYLPKEELKELRGKLHLTNSNKSDKEKRKNEAPVHALDGISLREAAINAQNVDKEGSVLRELRMLIASFRTIDILGHVAVDDAVVRKRAARLQEFMKYMENTGLSSIEINYAINLFILENLVLSGTDENGIMRVNDEDGVFPQNANQTWDDPYMILDDVGQSIADEEHRCLPTKVDMFEGSLDSAQDESSDSSRVSVRSTEGILRTSRSASHSPLGTRQSRRKSSVHFVDLEKHELLDCVTEGELDVRGMLQDDQDESLQAMLLDYLYNVQKRSFTEWCFEEFYEPHVMLQIIQAAFYKLPFLDIYRERRTEGKIVVLHNPFQEKLRYNHQHWDQWLHSNVGFRNYLDFISDKIKDWTREEEAIYQAVLLNKELKESENLIDEEIVKDKPKKGPEKPVKGKPSKSRSRSTSRSPSDDEHVTKELSFVLPGSLKAQKIEQDKILKAKEDEERKKEEKRSLSAQKKTDKDVSKDKTKRPSSKTSNKSKSKKSVIDDAQDQAQLVDNELMKLEPEDYWPFVGYDLGDNLAHFSGQVAHLFPSDGCTIRINKTQKLLDSTSIRVSIITPQSHVLSLHIVDPSSTNSEQVDNFQKVLDQFQNQSSVSRYGASTCVFNDGLCLAASNYGYSGSAVKKEPVLPEAPENQSHRSEEVVDEKKTNSFHESVNTDGVRRSFCNNSAERSNVDLRDIQNIILTSPNGVQVRVGYDMDDASQERRLLLLLTRCEPRGCRGHKKDKLQTHKELGRYILSDGRVVSVMSDDTIKIMFPDGTVAVASLHVETAVVREEETEEAKVEKANVRETPTQKKKKQPKVPSIDQSPMADSNPLEEHKEIINKTRTWVITNPNGESYETKADLNAFDIPEPSLKSQNKVVEEECGNTVEDQETNSSVPCVPQWKRFLQSPHLRDSLLISCATDPATGETLVTRSDGTLLLTTQEAGIFLSEHVDRTRFTKYFILEKPSHSKEHQDDPEEPKVTEIIQIETEHYPMVTIDRTNGKIETRFGSMGSLLSVSDGSHCFKHSDGTEIEYRPDGEMIFTAAGNSQMSYLQPYGSASYVLNTTSNIICEMQDSDGTEFVVDVSGNYEIRKNGKESETLRESNEEMSPKPTSAISGVSMVNCNLKETSTRKFDQHAPRVFFLNHDGSGSELLRYRDIVDTVVRAETDRDYFQYKESIQDHPHIIGHTIMHPTVNTKPWQYDYSRKTVLPKGLTCRDMKTFPATELSKEGPPFAMSMGKGLSITTNPFDVNVAGKTSGLTKGVSSRDPLQFRQFYHYPLITDEVRKRLALELVDYNKAVLRKRQKYKDLEIVDDQNADELVQAEDLRSKYESMRTVGAKALMEAVHSMADADSSTKSTNDDSSTTYQQRLVDNSSKPNSKRLDMLLEKERIEKEKEIENKKALSNKSVPNYFTSIYGNEFLINQAINLQTLNWSMKLFPSSREVTQRKEDSNPVNEEPLSESSAYSAAIEIEKPSDAGATYQTSSMTQQSTKKTDHQAVISKKETKYVYYDSSLIIPNLPKRMPVSTDLPLPRYLYSERPSIEQNIKQATVEDPVRRRQLTSSVVGGPVIGQIFQRQCRGLNVLPSRIDTGLLREGQRYSFKIKIINTGPESSHFKIKQPPSASGIWIEFVPGPIAAGLSRTITVHVYAIAKSVESNDSQVCVIEQTLTIVTDTDILEIPVVGRVMTAQRFDTIYPSGKLAECAIPEVVESLPPIVNESKRSSVELGRL